MGEKTTGLEGSHVEIVADPPVDKRTREIMDRMYDDEDFRKTLALIIQRQGDISSSLKELAGQVGRLAEQISAITSSAQVDATSLRYVSERLSKVEGVVDGMPESYVPRREHMEKQALQSRYENETTQRVTTLEQALKSLNETRIQVSNQFIYIAIAAIAGGVVTHFIGH